MPKVRLNKRQRARKRELLMIAEAANPRHGKPKGCQTVTEVGDYGTSCANINPFNTLVRGRDWSYNGRVNKHGKGKSLLK